MADSVPSSLGNKPDILMPSISQISALSIVIPLLISFFRLSDVDRNYYPLMFMIWLGALNEIASYFLIRNGIGNMASSNIYVLFDAALIYLQFYCWKVFSSKKYFLLLLGITGITWIIDNGFLTKMREYCSYFGMLYSFFAVIIAILMVNKIIVTEKRSLFKNAIFLFCTGIIIFYTYDVLVEIFWIYGLNKSATFQNGIYIILDYVNIFTNIIYAIAILWIPKKQEFIPQY
jgi:hypothetical protein